MFPHRGLVRFFYSAHLTLRFYLRLCRATSAYSALFYTPCRAVACLYPSQFILPSGNLQLSRLGVLIGACRPLGDGSYCKKSRSNDLHTLLLFVLCLCTELHQYDPVEEGGGENGYQAPDAHEGKPRQSHRE